MSQNKKRIGLLPGTFDPPTLGHCDLIERGANLCDELIVAIAQTNVKEPHQLFTAEERIELLKTITHHLPNVKITMFMGLTIDYANTMGASLLIRGVRNECDYSWETQLAAANRTMGGLETIFLPSTEEFIHISSRLVRELGAAGKRLTAFIPKAIEERVRCELMR